MSDEPGEPASSEQATGPAAKDQPTHEVPALPLSPPEPATTTPPAPAPPAPPRAPSAPLTTPPQLWSTPPAAADSSSDGGFDTERVIAVARSLAEKPEVLLGAAFGGGILLAIIIRRLGS